MMKTAAAVTLFLAMPFFQIALGQDGKAQALYCFSCGLGRTCTDALLDICKEGTKCGTVKGLSDYKVQESILARGCVTDKKCDKQERLIYANTPYRVKYSCCDTNLCNAGSPGAARLSLTSFLLLAVATTVTVLLAFCS